MFAAASTECFQYWETFQRQYEDERLILQTISFFKSDSTDCTETIHPETLIEANLYVEGNRKCLQFHNCISLARTIVKAALHEN